jgi:WD40 repeat protein
VYRLVEGTWIQVGGDLDGVTGDGFGHSVTLSADGTRLLAAGLSGGAESIRLYTLVGNAWAPAATPNFGTGGRIESTALSPDGRTAAYSNVYFAGTAGSASGVVRLYPLP